MENLRRSIPEKLVHQSLGRLVPRLIQGRILMNLGDWQLLESLGILPVLGDLGVLFFEFVHFFVGERLVDAVSEDSEHVALGLLPFLWVRV